MKRNKIKKLTYQYIKRELKTQKEDLRIRNGAVDNVYEYQRVDRVDGMLLLAEELGLMSNKKIQKLKNKKMEIEEYIFNL